jgi:hypothetical protein
MAATMADATIAPIPGIVVSRRATSGDIFGRRQPDVMAVSGENATQMMRAHRASRKAYP